MLESTRARVRGAMMTVGGRSSIVRKESTRARVRGAIRVLERSLLRLGESTRARVRGAILSSDPLGRNELGIHSRPRARCDDRRRRGRRSRQNPLAPACEVRCAGGTEDDATRLNPLAPACEVRCSSHRAPAPE